VNLLDEAANPILDSRAKSCQAKNCLTKSRFLKPRSGRQIMWVLLLVPFVGLLWVPFYNFQEPALFGFPFFYWYQLAWVPICSLLIWLVYRSRPSDET
jgi:FtsH-binding integral membrane protein